MSARCSRDNSRRRRPREIEPPHVAKRQRREHHADDGIVRWDSMASCSVPTETEEALLSEALMTYGTKERGMMCRASAKRIHLLQRKCREHGMHPLAACSLRRMHMKHSNPFIPHDKLRLGNSKLIREAANLFEECVASHLRRLRIRYRDEEQQQQAFTKRKQQFTVTPDFLLESPTPFLHGNEVEPFLANWIEVKMFYGASTIPEGSKCAIGPLVAKAKKYKEALGPGIMVFMYGCGAQLAAKLLQEGVLAFGPDKSVDFSQIMAQMRTWCATRDGTVLP